MTDRTAEEAKREALIARCERDAHNLTFPFMAPTIKEQHEAAQTLMDCAAVLQWQAEQQKGEADPLDMPLPCDITVGHVTMSKGVSLRSLVFRMKALYELAQEASSLPQAPQGEQE